MKKSEAFEFGEGGPGLFTRGADTKAEAVKAMQEWWDDDAEYNKERYGYVMFSENTITQDLIYEHRACRMWTVGGNICIECGEPTRGKGRITFTMFFPENNRASIT